MPNAEPTTGPVVPFNAFELLSQMFVQAPIGMAVLEGHGLLYTYANPKYQQIVGDRDPVGKRMVEMFPDLAGSEIEGVIERVYDTAVPFTASDLLVRFDSRGTGELDNYYDLLYHPLAKPTGKPHGVLVVAVDVTERHAAAERERSLVLVEDARVQAESVVEQLEAVFRQAPSFLAVFRGPTHVCASANDAYYRLIGPGRDIIGKPMLEALPEVAGQGFDVLLSRVLETGEPFVAQELPVRLARAVGAGFEDRVVSLTYLPLLDGAGERVGVIAHGRDVTDHVRAQEQVERLLAESERARADAEVATQVADEARGFAEAANRAKGDFLAVMSHELRTPLNAIAGYAELLEMGIRGPVTPEQVSDLHRIKQSQQHLLRLIDQVLNHTRIEMQGVVYVPTNVSVTLAVRSAEALVLPQLNERGLTCVLDLSEPELVVLGDFDKLQQILLNLLTNALKFTNPGGRVAVTSIAVGANVAITVADTGIGIADDKLATIFEPFMQVDMTRTRAHSGVGLGLSISRDLARGMGGDLVVSSTAGVGSAFTVVLPAA